MYGSGKPYLYQEKKHETSDQTCLKLSTQSSTVKQMLSTQSSIVKQAAQWNKACSYQRKAAQRNKQHSETRLEAINAKQHSETRLFRAAPELEVGVLHGGQVVTAGRWL